jgi:hypothetical protein
MTALFAAGQNGALFLLTQINDIALRAMSDALTTTVAIACTTDV